ncbi:hypothetical protein QEG73_04875 [Chitinophagaceae bacterium 26-R-25]|nr:hypothetical protein [Chitinophagaceae bacterium 26-R-25]
MKKNKIENVAFALSFTLAICLTSCQKVFDYIHKPGNGDAVSNICQVQTLAVDGPWGPTSYAFNYNKHNDLESLIVTPQADGYTNMFFFYDNKHRTNKVLHSSLPDVTNPDYVWRTDKFEYNKANQIIRDSLIIPYFHFIIVSLPQYDAYDRVIATVDSVWSNGNLQGMYLYFYKYDERGNLARQVRRYKGDQTSWIFYSDTLKLAPYDDKISIRQPNKFWMYIDRNYSINNCLSGATYNNFGLPVNFEGEQYSRGYNWFLNYLNGKVTVEYQCDAKGNH